MSNVITPIATQALLDAGFNHMVSFGRPLVDTFVKTYESINGPRDAVIQIREERGNFWFFGRFDSEGRNILQGCSGAGFLPCEIENPAKWVAKYIADAERTVRHSFAIRLMEGPRVNIDGQSFAIKRTMPEAPQAGGFHE
jgi:hypothetical protein